LAVSTLSPYEKVSEFGFDYNWLQHSNFNAIVEDGGHGSGAEENFNFATTSVMNAGPFPRF
jgi:hypothetical protein